MLGQGRAGGECASIQPGCQEEEEGGQRVSANESAS